MSLRLTGLETVAPEENWLPPNGTQKAARRRPLLPAVPCGAIPTTREGGTMVDTERAVVSLPLFPPRSSLVHPFPSGRLCRPREGLNGQSCGPGAVTSS